MYMYIYIRVYKLFIYKIVQEAGVNSKGVKLALIYRKETGC